jgi:hypothetical protein
MEAAQASIAVNKYTIVVILLTNPSVLLHRY